MGATTTKLALPYPTPSDPNNVPADIQRLANAVDAIAASRAEGTAAARPAAGVSGRIYTATDTSAVFYDTGTAWIQLNISTASIVTTTGDLLVASGAGALARLPVGSNGQVLQAQSGAPNGVQWAGNGQGLPLGLAGATALTRYVGATTSGKPTSGTFQVGDFAIAQDGVVWVYATGGTWIAATAASIGQALGLNGATAATRYAGATTSGAPSIGTFLTGDFVIDQSGGVWICTAGGTPGTWHSSYEAALGRPAASSGATAATHYAGATTSGHPTSGTFGAGDFVIGQDGALWICTAGGFPGTWSGIRRADSFAAYQSTSQMIQPATWTPLNFDVVSIDTAGGRAANQPSYYVARQDGVYRASGSVGFQAMSTGNGSGCRIALNGSAVPGTVVFIPFIQKGGFNCCPSAAANLQCRAGDVIEVQGYQSTDAQLATSVSQGDVRSRFDVDQIA